MQCTTIEKPLIKGELYVFAHQFIIIGILKEDYLVEIFMRGFL